MIFLFAYAVIVTCAYLYMAMRCVASDAEADTWYGDALRYARDAQRLRAELSKWKRPRQKNGRFVK